MSEPSVPAYDVVRGEVEKVMAEIIKGGDVESLLNDLNIPNCTYQQISTTPASNTYFTGSTIYYMPKKEF